MSPDRVVACPRWLSIVILSCGLGLCVPTLGRAQQPPAPSTPPAGAPSAPPAQQPPPQQPPPAQQAQATQSLYIFSSDAGVILNFIKPDKTADFEAVMAKLKQALMKSENPQRRQQAAGWKIFKAAENGPNGSVIYVSLMDPTLKGADYSPGQLLVEAFGAEAQTLFKQYAEAYGSPAQNILHLTLSTDMSK